MPGVRLGFIPLLLLGAACTAPQESRTAAVDGCAPLETRPANGESFGQTPAFPGQTRACGVTSNMAFTLDTLATGLVKPWAVEPLPDGSLLVTEKGGNLRIVSQAGEVGAPIAGVLPVDSVRQGGLLDVALSPAFESDRTIFWSFAEPRPGGNGTSVARGVLAADGSSLSDVRVILRVLPTYDGGLHFGSRLAFGPDGLLYVTTGERSDAAMREHAQRLDGHLGKVLRIHPDGSVPADNPFAGDEGAQPEIWSRGHRNIQAAAFDPHGQLWTIEHGTNGGDELNRIRPGGNYGWPLQAYGKEYNGERLPGSPQVADTTIAQPVYYWDPVIAPSGAQFYTGALFPEWQNSLFVGSLRQTRLVRMVVEGERVTGEEHLLADVNQRIRDVRQGPDGALYLVTDAVDGILLKIGR